MAALLTVAACDGVPLSATAGSIEDEAYDAGRREVEFEWNGENMPGIKAKTKIAY
jgi:hypothetical protein